VLDQIRRDIQARLEELHGEIDKLRRALAALTSRESEPERSGRAAPVAGAAVDESVAKSARRAPRTRKASVPPRPTAPTPAVSAAAPTSARTAPGATKAAILTVLKDGSAMTAGEIAAATGLARASVSTTLSKLAGSGQVAKAARGYQLRRESDRARKPARPRPSAGRASLSATLSQLAKAGELRKAAGGYRLAGVEPAQRFYFRIEDDTTPRVVVANLPELAAAIAVCGPGVLRHHCAEHDFSRWVAGVFHDEPLAAEIAAAERQLSADSPTVTVEHVRLALIAALQARHATQRASR
jgi:DNA-binding transcriptional ArsR family regulator